MYYLDTNAIINMDKQNIHLSNNQSQKAFTSLLVLQEIVKGLGKEDIPVDELTKRMGHFLWLERNNISIHWKSHIQCFGLAFQINIDYTLSNNMQKFYELVIDADPEDYRSLIKEYREMILFSDDQLKIMNKGMRKDLNKGIEESLNNSPVGKEAIQKLIAADDGDFDNLPSLRQLLLDQLSPIIIQGSFLSVNAITGNQILQEEWQNYLSRYSGLLDAYVQMQLSFYRHHFLMGEIVYNDIPDIMHTVYLYNTSIKLVTNDRNFRRLLKQTLGSRYGLTLKEFLAKVK